MKKKKGDSGLVVQKEISLALQIVASQSETAARFPKSGLNKQDS